MGEQQGLQRLRYYLGLEPGDGGSGSGTLAAGEPPPIADYAEARMGAWGVDSSAKLSPFLALGCLSPRMVYWEVLRLAAAEQEAAEGLTATPHAAAAAAAAGATGAGTAGTGAAAGAAAVGAAAARAAAEPHVWREPQKGDTWEWLLMHLGIRDFFIFSAMQNEAALERPEGMSGRLVEWQEDAALFERWARGQTGLPFVDASMRELAATGWMSNRGRQNVASLLSKALRLDWRLGAELFASLLVDHDWTLNTTNWAYNSGVGADPRDRSFRTVSQGQRYDPGARLIRAWLPELSGLPAELAHQPWAASAEQLAAARLCLGHCPAAGTAAPAEGVAGQAGEAAVGGEEDSGMHYYPTPVVDPATQIAKGPKGRRQ
ncbi:hypothetical protein COHA_002872 [Chlorella ohadii]|uniref:Cryptochrome/DNA photolyase FAD-binding domain-containing protein n=1 Tax=Chlorella ohadii TaxID=2649997 RepID=A0AAD5DSQ5_9CHLO|nr:hypothetical protein COHA_002872 [Chlorella ohadii]